MGEKPKKSCKVKRQGKNRAKKKTKKRKAIEKKARFGLRANSSLIWGEGGGGGYFSFHSVQDCS